MPFRIRAAQRADDPAGGMRDRDRAIVAHQRAVRGEEVLQVRNLLPVGGYIRVVPAQVRVVVLDEDEVSVGPGQVASRLARPAAFALVGTAAAPSIEAPSAASTSSQHDVRKRVLARDHVRLDTSTVLSSKGPRPRRGPTGNLRSRCGGLCGGSVNLAKDVACQLEICRPYKLASSGLGHRDATVLEICGRVVGGLKRP